MLNGVAFSFHDLPFFVSLKKGKLAVLRPSFHVSFFRSPRTPSYARRSDIAWNLLSLHRQVPPAPVHASLKAVKIPQYAKRNFQCYALPNAAGAQLFSALDRSTDQNCNEIAPCNL